MTYARLKRVNEVADALQGTCDCLEDHTTEDERDDQEFLRELDDIVFCCVTCGWWCEIGDQSDDDSGEQTCNDCFPGY